MRRIDKISKIVKMTDQLYKMQIKASGILGAALFALPVVGGLIDKWLEGETAESLAILQKELSILVDSSFIEKTDEANVLRKAISTMEQLKKILPTMNASADEEDIQNFMSITSDLINRLSIIPSVIDRNQNFFETFVDKLEGVVGLNQSSLNARLLINTLDPETIKSAMSKLRVGGGALQGLLTGIITTTTALTGGTIAPITGTLASAVLGSLSIAQDAKFNASNLASSLSKDLVIIQDKIQEAQSKPITSPLKVKETMSQEDDKNAGYADLII